MFAVITPHHTHAHTHTPLTLCIRVSAPFDVCAGRAGLILGGQACHMRAMRGNSGAEREREGGWPNLTWGCKNLNRNV